MDKLFFDTYALIEIFNGTRSYATYCQAHMAITKMNLFELYFYLLRNQRIEDADWALRHYEAFVLDVDSKVIPKAATLKIKSRHMSTTDCIGYATAQRLGILFLTGDKEFKGMPGVEFVQ